MNLLEVTGKPLAVQIVPHFSTSIKRVTEKIVVDKPH
jgi:hypothetical protein